jgi:hypothetical protein
MLHAALRSVHDLRHLRVCAVGHRRGAHGKG